jgi:cyclase
MPLLRWRLHFQVVVLGLLIFAAGNARCSQMATQEVTKDVIVFSTSGGNVVACIGRDGVLLLGTPSADSTAAISEYLRSKTQSNARYVVVWAEDMSHTEGDAGWTSRGAFVAMQEHALDRLGGHSMGANQPVPARLLQLGADRPRIAFSEVITFDLNDEAVHIVHQPAAFSNADAIAHFHLAKLVYFGEVFPGNEYPRIDSALGGSLDGFSKILGSWADDSFHIVPARGEVTNGSAIRDYLHMIDTVRERVQRGVTSGQTEQQILAAKPTEEFDARWGHGRVSAAEFVHEVYVAVDAATKKQ